MALILGAPEAGATPYDAYGAGARGAAMGGAQTAAADGAESLHYNVSRLALSEPRLSVGVMSTYGRPRILLKDRPDGYDVPTIGPPARYPGSEQTPPPEDTEGGAPLVALTFGGVSEVVVEGLHFGFLIFLPIPTPVTLETRFADERERLFSNSLRFERLGPRAHHLDIEIGLAYTVTEWLAVGVGAAYLPGFGVDTGVYLADATDQTDADTNARIETRNAWGLLVGASLDLPADLRVAASYRDSTAMRLTNENEIHINGVTDKEPILQNTEWVPIFSPARGAVGVAWAPENFTLSADLRYTLWANYVDSQAQDAHFRNVASGAIGVEVPYSERTRLRFGGWYEPTMVPDQTGRTNYVDNARLGASMGAGHTMTVGDREVAVSWYLRGQFLLPRDTDKRPLESYPDCAPDVTSLCDEIPDDLEDPVTKAPFPEARGLQTGNPGFPGFTSGGWFGSVGLEVSY